MVDTSVLGPVSVQAAGFQEPIALLEKEMVLNQLLAVLLAHAIETIVGAC